MIPVQTGELAGLPAFSAPADGPTLGMLFFRVGTADEELISAGITHLVEHLAMRFSAEAPSSFSCNASVGHLCTTFWARGRPQEVSGFLQRVSASLHALPFDHLGDEVRVLRAERMPSPPPIESILAVRFGATTYGLGAYPDFGLFDVNSASAQAWADRRFVRQNAALGFVGAIPDELSLELADGEASSMPLYETRRFLFPGWRSSGSDLVAISAITEYSEASIQSLSCARRTLASRLRFDGRMTYSVEGSYETLNAEQAHFAIWASIVPGQQEVGVSAFSETILRLATDGPDPALLGSIKETRRRFNDDPESALVLISKCALDHLLGMPALSDAAKLADIEAVSPEAVAKVAAKWFDSAIMFTPLLTEPSLEGIKFHELPKGSERRLPGQRFVRTRPVPNGIQQIYASPQGVMAVMDATTVVTVPFDECVALARLSGGTRVLYNKEGFVLPLTPGDWKRWDDLVRMVDEGVPQQRQVTRDDGGLTTLRPHGFSLLRRQVRLGPWQRAVLVFVQVMACVALTRLLIGGAISAAPTAGSARWLALITLAVLLVLLPVMIARGLP